MSVVSITQHYRSSTRIDNTQISEQAFIDDFVVHGSNAGILQTLAKDISHSGQRAFTITGPYGSGKSTLALFLSLLLSSDKVTAQAARQKLVDADIEADELLTYFGKRNGWNTIKHVCGVEHPLLALTRSVSSQLSVSHNTEQLEQLSDEQLLFQLEQMLNNCECESDGIFILVDEMGKALDYLSRNNQDLHIFQSIADIVQQSQKTVVLIGFLHQSFADYARNKESSAQKEWGKVQGRYKDFSFNPSVEESLVLVADSIDKPSSLAEGLSKNFGNSLKVAYKHLDVSPAGQTALEKCLPLSPEVALLLGPISKRRFSQNERSLFGFLASHERFGFREFCENQYSEEAISNLYTADMLWQYLLHNLDHTISSSADSKPWLEAKDAVDRAQYKGGELHYKITTLIALFTLFGFHYHLHARRAFLLDSFVAQGYKKAEIDKAISDLESWSVIIFRSQHEAFFVFQGSDIDVHALTDEKVSLIKDGIDWTAACKTSRRVLASRHYHQTGTMRWADIHFFSRIDKAFNTFCDSTKTAKTGAAFMHYVVVTDSSAKDAILKRLGSHTHVAIAGDVELSELKQLAIESIALNKVEEETPKIQHDNIALKELLARKDRTQASLEEEINHLLENASWQHLGIVHEARGLSALTSTLADTIYTSSPVLTNELVNRSKPSGNANSATKKLMERMLNEADTEDLGFSNDEFPPEKGIYLSIIKNNGLHQYTDEGFRFVVEELSNSERSNVKIAALMEDTLGFIKTSASREKLTIEALYNFWMAPPYGITIGICRLLCMALLKALEGKIAFYDLDSTNTFIYIPELDQELVDKIFKHPHEAAIRYYEHTEIEGHLIKTLADATVGANSSESNEVILSIAKHIAQLVHLLPSWVKKTSGNIFGNNVGSFKLATKTKVFRDSVLRASDPFDLVLKVLPETFEFDDNSQDSSKRLASEISNAIEELKSQHLELTGSFETLISRLLNSEFNENLSKRCDIVLSNAQRPTVREFAHRLQNAIKGTQSVEHLISLAAGVTEKNWNDKYLRTAYDDIQNLCLQFRRAEAFAKASEGLLADEVSILIPEENGKFKHAKEIVSSTILNDKKIKSLSNSISAQSSALNREEKIALLSNLAEQLLKEEEALAIHD
ncbi:MAG: hypothetical protein C9356_02645 [Oleiphilus sp.]|nr:MAG: hypothetical protein C9356_02645 [Oleiphilus sp.]